MKPEIIASIIVSSAALIAAVLSTIISIRTLRIQKRISNSPLQIEYLNRKLILFEKIKEDLIVIDHKIYGNSPLTKEQLKEIAAISSNDMLTFLSQATEKFKGYIFDSNLITIDNDIQRIKRFHTFLHVLDINKQAKPDEDFADLQNQNPVYVMYEVKERFKKAIIEEISNCTRKIEKHYKF
jgi:hypothetical protein